MLGQVYIHMKKNESGLSTYNINKDQFQMNCRSKHEGKTSKHIEENRKISWR